VTGRRLLVLGGAAVVVIAGAFVLWLQAGLVYSFGALALGGNGLQSHLSASAAGLTSGDYAEALGQADEAMSSAEWLDRSAHTPQVELLGYVPYLGTAVMNWQLLASASTQIAGSTENLLQLYGDLSGKSGGPRIFSDGAINLERLTDLPAKVATADASLAAAQQALMDMQTSSRTAVLLDKIRDKALKEMKPVRQAVSALRGIAPTLPDALGANGPRRYLVAIENQAEMRASGGAPLSLLMVEFDNGRISIPIKGQTSTQLFPPLNAPVVWWGPGGNPFFDSNPRNDPFVVTNTHPNLLFSGREMVGAWAGGGFPPVDGVITIDLSAIAAVLNATGPIASDAYGQVSGEQLGKILLVDAYQTFGQSDATARQEANQQLLDDLLNRILGGDDLVAAAQAMLSTAPGRHVQFWMRNAALEQLAIDSGTAGEVSDPGEGDWSALYTQNGNQSKVDVFQQRNVLVTAQLNADGSAHVTQQMTVANATPADRPEGPPERIGYETSWLKAAYVMYVPDAATNYRVTYPQGFAVRPFKNHQQLGGGWANDGFGHRFVRVVGWTKPAGQAVVSIDYDMPAGTFSGPGGELYYALEALPQSLWNPSILTVQVNAPAGFFPVPQEGMKTQGSSAVVSAVQSAPVDVAMTFTR